MRRALLVVYSILLIVTTSIFAGQWGKPPEGWDDFKFGLVDENMPPRNEQLVKALDAGIQIDYRYRYCTSTDAPGGWIFTSTYNYAKGPHGIRPSITIYMAAANSDNINTLLQSCSNTAYMTKYFKAVKHVADSCKGYSPIYTIEPDVWGYFLQDDMGGLGEKYFNKTCQINNLGFSCLSQFTNTFRDFAAAIICLLKDTDPDCYAGIMMNHWGFNSFWLPTPEENAKKTIPYLEKILRDPYKGDVIFFEKYGADAGSTAEIWMWDDNRNADFLVWCKTLAKGIDLPICGWQTSIGYFDEPGYPELPNEPNKYQDTFFPYFFRHVDDFLNAGFIGFMASCNNQRQGTVWGLKMGEYDNGWFLDRLKEFNAERPYNLNISTAIENPNEFVQKDIKDAQINISNSKQNISLKVNAAIPDLIVDLYNLKGLRISIKYDKQIVSGNTIIELDKRNLSSGIYFAEIISSVFTKTMSFTVTR